jgi:hypothetical protein
VRVEPEVEVNVGVSPAQADPQAAGGTTATKGIGYLDGMRAAGYPLDLNNDLNTLVALKSLGVTPEYAKSGSGRVSNRSSPTSNLPSAD